MLTFDPGRLLYPGDLLHEAGHLAVLPANERTLVNGPVGDDGAFEMSAIAWSWAAALRLDCRPQSCFTPMVTRADQTVLWKILRPGRYFGVPMLEFFGMTRKGEYPAMRRWRSARLDLGAF